MLVCRFASIYFENGGGELSWIAEQGKLLASHDAECFLTCCSCYYTMRYDKRIPNMDLGDFQEGILHC